MSRRNRQNKQSLVPQQPRSGLAAVRQEVSFSGPLPPPGLLEKYNEVIPNGAERIMVMAERQSAHRESIEAQVVAGNVRSQERGSLYAFIICAIAVIGGLVLIAMNKELSGLVSLIGSLSVLASVFIYSKSEQRKEREEKSNALAARSRD